MSNLNKLMRWSCLSLLSRCPDPFASCHHLCHDLGGRHLLCPTGQVQHMQRDTFSPHEKPTTFMLHQYDRVYYKGVVVHKYFWQSICWCVVACTVTAHMCWTLGCCLHCYSARGPPIFWVCLRSAPGRHLRATSVAPANQKEVDCPFSSMSVQELLQWRSSLFSTCLHVLLLAIIFLLLCEQRLTIFFCADLARGDVNYCQLITNGQTQSHERCLDAPGSNVPFPFGLSRSVPPTVWAFPRSSLWPSFHTHPQTGTK